nr:hypothetical protein [Emcibacter nanhaiensis]
MSSWSRDKRSRASVKMMLNLPFKASSIRAWMPGRIKEAPLTALS